MNATDPQRIRQFNPLGPAGYFFTILTYGSWLHGDKRGSVDRKSNLPGAPILDPNENLERFQRSMMIDSPVYLCQNQRKIIETTIREVVSHNNWLLHAVNARTQHVHAVITAIKKPESVMNSLKSWCTRRMREKGLWTSENTPWARHGSTRYLWSEKDVRDAANYVLNCQD
jgi:REP element-mobilizing transposase RayT